MMMELIIEDGGSSTLVGKPCYIKGDIHSLADGKVGLGNRYSDDRYIINGTFGGTEMTKTAIDNMSAVVMQRRCLYHLNPEKGKCKQQYCQ